MTESTLLLTALIIALALEKGQRAQARSAIDKTLLKDALSRAHKSRRLTCPLAHPRPHLTHLAG